MCEQHVVRSAFLDGAQGLTSSRTAIEVSPAPETVGVFSGEGFLALLGFSSEFTSPLLPQDWETARHNKASHRERSWPGRPAGLSPGAQVLGSSCTVTFYVIARGDRPGTVSGGVTPNRGHRDEPRARVAAPSPALLWMRDLSSLAWGGGGDPTAKAYSSKTLKAI